MPRVYRRTWEIKIGDVFGSRVAISEPFKKGIRWHCLARCGCGQMQEVNVNALVGRRADKCLACQSLKPVTHGMSKTPLYGRWADMKSRCSRGTRTDYHRYGGRGITVCKEWAESFEVFRDLALANGYRPGLEIDRRDNGGNYEPGNCRWVPHVVNGNNTSTNRLLTAFGETKSMADWARDPRCTVAYYSLRTRLRYGWSPEDAVTRPLRKAVA